MGILDDLTKGAKDLIDKFLGETSETVEDIAVIAGVDLGPIWERIDSVKYLNANYFITAMDEITKLADRLITLINTKIKEASGVFASNIKSLKTKMDSKFSLISNLITSKIAEVKTTIASKIKGVTDLYTSLSASVTSRITTIYKTIGAISDILLNPAALIQLIENALLAVW